MSLALRICKKSLGSAFFQLFFNVENSVEIVEYFLYIHFIFRFYVNFNDFYFFSQILTSFF